jgi:hypothetical protein
VPRLEEITYEAGRQALADQEALVSGIRQRTGTLLAAHALVASFLGAATIRAQGLEPLGWIALAALVLGLCASAVLLAPWQLKFAVDARELGKPIHALPGPLVDRGDTPQELTQDRAILDRARLEPRDLAVRRGRTQVCHERFDHTSLIKTTLLRFATEPEETIARMGARVRHAPHLEVALRDTARTDIPQHEAERTQIADWRTSARTARRGNAARGHSVARDGAGQALGLHESRKS